MIETSVLISQAADFQLSPVLIMPIALSIEESGDISVGSMLLPFIDLNKTRSLAMFAGNVGRVAIGESGTVVDYVPIGIDVAAATSVALRCRDAWDHEVMATGYVTADGLIRRVLDGTEFPVPGRYKVSPYVVSARFTGNLEPFDVIAVGES